MYFIFFKKWNLRSGLFKRQSIFEGKLFVCLKQMNSTCWVEHQGAVLNLHINNLPILAGFCNNQILCLHNREMTKIKSKLEGYQNDVCDTRVIFRLSNLTYFVFLSLLVRLCIRFLF